MSARIHTVAVCLILGCYGCGRLLQVLHGPPPILPLVAMEVLAALALALVDGARNLGARGIFVFVAICALVGNAMENLGVATGFPFGHYHFLDVMGPKIFVVPILLGLAYVGLAYASWMLAFFLVGDARHRAVTRMLALPLLASVIMVAWDFAQDPVWSTLLHAWVWRDGGAWFGVPLSNYFGWLLTCFLIFALFAASQRRTRPERDVSAWPALALYALCAVGNVLQVLSGPYSTMAYDAKGTPWRISHILGSSALVSFFVMGSIVALAGSRLMARVVRQSAPVTD